MHGARRVRVLAAVEAGVQDRVGAGLDAQGRVAGTQRALLGAAALRDGEDGSRLDDEAVVVAAPDGEVPAAQGAYQGQALVPGGRDMDLAVAAGVRLARLTQEQVPAALGERQDPGGARDRVRTQRRAEPPVGHLDREDGHLVVAAVLEQQLPRGVGLVGEAAPDGEQPVLVPGQGVDEGPYGLVAQLHVPGGVGEDEQFAPGAEGWRPAGVSGRTARADHSSSPRTRPTPTGRSCGAPRSRRSRRPRSAPGAARRRRCVPSARRGGRAPPWCASSRRAAP